MTNRIKVLVDESGKTMKEISEKSGVGYQALTTYYRGEREPKTDNAKKLADFFKVSIPYLMGIDSQNKWFNRQISNEDRYIDDLKKEKERLKELLVIKNDIETAIDFLDDSQKKAVSAKLSYIYEAIEKTEKLISSIETLIKSNSAIYEHGLHNKVTLEDEENEKLFDEISDEIRFNESFKNMMSSFFELSPNDKEKVIDYVSNLHELEKLKIYKSTMGKQE